MFRTSSDTEVILQGYEEWGASVVERLRGHVCVRAVGRRRAAPVAGARPAGHQAALRLSRQRLSAVRLRGPRAARVEPGAADARPIRARSIPGVSERAGTADAGSRRADDCRRATSCASGADGREVARRYWDLLDSAASKIAATPDECRRRVRELLEESAALHLVSDVPVGVFLSGGIDSGAVAALVRQTGVVPRTFSVAFAGTSYDEAPYARVMAKSLRREHTEIVAERGGRARADSGRAGERRPSERRRHQHLHRLARGARGRAQGGAVGPRRRRVLRRVSVVPPAAPRRRDGCARGGIRRGSCGASAGSAVRRSAGRRSRRSRRRRCSRPTARCRRRSRSCGSCFPKRSGSICSALTPVEVVAHQGDPYVVSAATHARSRSRSGPDVARLVRRSADLHARRAAARHRSDEHGHGLEVRVPLLDHRLVEYLMRLPEAAKSGQARRSRCSSAASPSRCPTTASIVRSGASSCRSTCGCAARCGRLCERHLGPQASAGRGLFNAGAIESVWRSFLTGSRARRGRGRGRSLR